MGTGRHWALIVGSTSPRERVSRLRLYTYSTLDIIYYILYLISSILYSVQYIYEPGWKTRKEISVLRVRTFSATRFACKTRAFFFALGEYSIFFRLLICWSQPIYNKYVIETDFERYGNWKGS
jgi:hypothetical protein